jgi:fermentation-respiration switch protein FrsA (DUF1100 family)
MSGAEEGTVVAERRDVVFTSGDSFVAGWLFLPEQAGTDARVPAVAMAHGLGAVKEMYLEPFARRFADAGIAALLFDYRSFGRAVVSRAAGSFRATRSRTTGAR